MPLVSCSPGLTIKVGRLASRGIHHKRVGMMSYDRIQLTRNLSQVFRATFRSIGSLEVCATVPVHALDLDSPPLTSPGLS